MWFSYIREGVMTKIAIFDGNNILHRSMRVGELAGLESRNGKPTGGLFGVLRIIRSILYEYNIDKCFFVMDDGISSRRREIFPEYKGDKYRSRDDPYYVEPDDEKKDYHRKFLSQRAVLFLMLPMLGIRTIKISGWEADDLICALVNEIKNHDTGTIYVVSNDGDMLQLVGEHRGTSINIIRYRGKKHDSGSPTEIISLYNFEKREGCKIHEYLFRRAILGDKNSDNIPGVPGAGKVTVEKLLEHRDEFNVVYPFDDIFIHCDGNKDFRFRKVAEYIDVLLRNYDLMRLDMEDVSSISDVIEDCVLLNPDVKLASLKRMLTELDLFSILKDLHSWIIPFQNLT